MAATTLAEGIAKALEDGRGDRAGEARFLPLVTLDSGARCALDPEGRWLFVGDDGKPPTRFAPDTAHLFHEVLESPRRRFDAAIEEGARELGLPPTDVAWSFPALEIVRSVLVKEHPYLTRLALEWIGPTELRDMRAEIVAVTKVKSLPVSVRELAGRLIVPE